jgi:enhancer of mRNA-decapping protein 4
VYNSLWALQVLEHARRVAVDRKFLCYALVGKSQQGLVRVIDRASGARTLLRGHKKPLSDLAFASGRPLLATSGGGELYARYLSEEAGTISEEQCAHVRLNGRGASKQGQAPSMRLAWRESTLSPRWLAFSAGDRVYLLPAPLPGSSSGLDLELDVTSATPAELHCVPSAGAALSADVTDLEFSPCGSRLAVALGEEGTLAVFGLNELVLQEPSIKADHQMIATARAQFGGVAVDSVRWVANDALVTGTHRNRCLQLWRLREKSGAAGKRAYELVLEHYLDLEIEDKRKVSEPFYQLEVDIPSSLVILASAHPCDKHALATLHFRTGAGQWGFDHVCVYSSAMPTVSFCPLREGDGDSLSLYCVQSEAINHLTLDPAECSPAEGNGAAAASAAPAAAREASATNSEGGGSTGSGMFGGRAQESSDSEGGSDESASEDEDDGAYSLMAHLEGSMGKKKPPPKAAPAVVAAPRVETRAPPAEEEVQQPGLLTPEAILKQARLAVQDFRDKLPKGSDEEGEGEEASAAPLVPMASLAKPASCSSLGLYEAADSVASGASVEALKRDMLAQQGQMEQSLMNMIETRLVKPLNKQSQMMESRINRKLDEIKEDFHKKVGDQRKTTEKVLLAVSASLNKELPLNLERIIQREIGQMAETIVEGVVPKLAEAFASGSALQKPLDDALARQIPDALKEPLQNGLKTNFERTIIPAFEATCRTAFSQIHSAVETGLERNNQAAEGHARTLLAAAESVQMAATAATRDSGSAMTGSVSAPMSLEELEARQDPTIEIKRLLGEGNAEGAFTKALETQNVEVVTWLCKAADLANLLGNHEGGDNPPLSQGVLLALLQQLSVDLVGDAKQRMPWVQAAVLLLDTDDKIFQNHMKTILSGLAEALATTAKKKQKGGTAQALTLCQHLVNSQLAVLNSKK